MKVESFQALLAQVPSMTEAQLDDLVVAVELRRFKAWVNRQFRGVSTKHLPNYLAWMRLWEWFKEGVKPEHVVVSGLGKQLINVPATS
jgi:hypothetical protein